MKKSASKNVAASVHQRLLNVARETGRPFNEVLQYFAMERLLYRLSCSGHKDSFVLKGALLFRVWDVPDSRATRDIDFLAFLDNSPENLAAIFREVCSIGGDDGLVFDPDSIVARTIKEDADYEGVRVRFRGLLGKARITMQVDVGFGDKVHPAIVQTDYPVILDLPTPSLRMYPPETVIAEKVLAEAIRQTLQNRKTKLIPFDQLKADLIENDILEKQWSAFLGKSGASGPETFHEVLDQIEAFLGPLFERINHLQ